MFPFTLRRKELGEMDKTLKKDINSKKFLLAVSPELYAKVKKIAVKNNRTVQGQIRSILEGIVSVWERKYGGQEAPKEEEPPDGGDTSWTSVLHFGAISSVRGHEAIRLLQ
jgi:hypothetical protein